MLLLSGCGSPGYREPTPPGPRTGQLYCKDPDNGIIYSPQAGQCDAGDVASNAEAFETYQAEAGNQTASAAEPAPPTPEPAAAAAPQPAPTPPQSSSPAPQPSAQTAAQDKPELELLGIGTSFFVSSDGYLLTNHHVIDGCEQMLIMTADGDYPARVVDSNQEIDLAILKVKKSGMPFAAFAAWLPEPGDTAYAVGYPLLGELRGIKITDGIVSGLTGIGGDDTRLQLSVPLQHGNSGGPVLDETGLVIGVVSEKIVAEDVEGVSFAIVPEVAGAFLAHNHVKPTIRRSDVERKARDIMRDASRYTWPALCFARPPA
ncbi:MAG TPA: trypsin-like peptidase domain-containing protein [Dongiaceae bacterium]|nr:trypsin-like peptidase domain-containing protein [Dongiaceae bacterium]